jgi:hypothetical protein
VAYRDSFKLSPLHVPDGSRLLPSFTALFKALDNIGDPPNRQRAITPPSSFATFTVWVQTDHPKHAPWTTRSTFSLRDFPSQPGLARLSVHRTRKRPRHWNCETSSSGTPPIGSSHTTILASYPKPNLSQSLGATKRMANVSTPGPNNIPGTGYCAQPFVLAVSFNRYYILPSPTSHLTP